LPLPPGNSAFTSLSYIPAQQITAAENASSERENELAAENARLKRQLAERDEELAILQKAATYFAKRLK
jgi:transposase-like protein